MNKIFIFLALIATFNLNIIPINGASSSSSTTSQVQTDNQENLDGRLVQAVADSNLNEVQRLIAAGADVDVQNTFATPLYRAVSFGNIDIVRALIDAQANINLGRASFDFTPLHEAVVHDYIDIAQLLINAGADINTQDLVGNTPLQHAIIGGNTDIYQLLIGAGANVNIKNENGDTSINLAQGETQQLLQNIVKVEQQLENLTPEDSIESILDQYDENVQSTIIKRLIIKRLILQGEFNLAARALEAYPDIQQNLNLNALLKYTLVNNDINNLKNFIEFVVNNNLLNLLNEDNAYIVEFINKWSQETLDPRTARVILLGEIPENANEIEYRVYKIARTNNYRRLGRFIRDWAERKNPLSQRGTPFFSDIASKIAGY